MKSFFRPLAFAAVFFAASACAGAATVHRCPAPGGGVNYTDAPCPDTGTALEIVPNELDTSGSRAAARWAARREGERAAQAVERQQQIVAEENRQRQAENLARAAEREQQKRCDALAERLDRIHLRHERRPSSTSSRIRKRLREEYKQAGCR
ncbi:MAG: hypothetical protein IK051_10910 [Rhodocyclaceae bacterium]|nr:hypothetical protein [Rhodocyclaceae bacterium]